MVEINEERKRRRGPIPLDVNERRNHCVSVRLNKHELELLDAQRSQFQRGEWLRMAAIDPLPCSIPAVNQKAWVELARLAGNLNQFQASINAGRASGYPSNFLEEVLAQVKALRRNLLGTGDFDERNAKG